MRHYFLLLIAIFLIGSINAQDSKPFLIVKSKLEDYKPINYSTLISYLDGEVLFFSTDENNGTIKNSIGYFKNSRKYYEQGLYIVEYIPTKFLDKNDTKYIYKFAYDSDGGKPVLVTEISYKSKDKYQVQIYYTDYYFELKENQK